MFKTTYCLFGRAWNEFHLSEASLEGLAVGKALVPKGGCLGRCRWQRGGGLVEIDRSYRGYESRTLQVAPLKSGTVRKGHGGRRGQAGAGGGRRGGLRQGRGKAGSRQGQGRDGQRQGRGKAGASPAHLRDLRPASPLAYWSRAREGIRAFGHRGTLATNRCATSLIDH